MTGPKPVGSPGHHRAASHWRRASAYSELRHCDRTAFAWEWLRRSVRYRQAWQSLGVESIGPGPDPHQFGLERFEDPDLPTPHARPLWCASIDPMVIRASVLDPLSTLEDRVDLRILSPLVSLAIDDDHVEHLLLSDGSRSLRIDIIEGTLIGCPASLRYTLEGLTQLRGPIAALDRLMSLIGRGRFVDPPETGATRYERWILELRVADALATGATHQEIARVLFDDLIADQRWRIDSAAYRQRVQRLASGARDNLERPLHMRWFGPGSRRRNESQAAKR